MDVAFVSGDQAQQPAVGGWSVYVCFSKETSQLFIFAFPPGDLLFEITVMLLLM